ncbi:VanZ family protein [Eubacterium sp.]|uniref:VanZ family protein n=1 Tax=Eubacterium sp. TaxID=142586 RepID=UPI003F05FADC
MQPENKHNRILCIVLWILTVLCMAAIFYFSSQPAVQSSGQSSAVTLFLQRLFHTQAFTNHLIRKTAHFVEFAGLGFLTSASVLLTFGKRYLGVIIASLYAATDEIHQIFVDGRSCQLTDWMLDTVGIITGALIFSAVFCIIRRIIKHKNQTKGDI